ncbi:YHS domain-containing protein [Candidatus Electrothrix laxa]
MRIFKTFSLAGLCLLMLLSFAGNVFAAPQTKCPVMGGDINKEVYADHEGKRVYFCCAACLPQFKENPEKYLAKLKEAGVELEAIPADNAAPAENMDHTDHEGHSGHAK